MWELGITDFGAATVEQNQWINDRGAVSVKRRQWSSVRLVGSKNLLRRPTELFKLCGSLEQGFAE